MYIGWHVHKEVFNGTASFRNQTHLAHDINIKSQSQISDLNGNSQQGEQQARSNSSNFKQQQQQATSPQSPSVVAAHTTYRMRCFHASKYI
jgi:hypothetical protein